MTAAAPAPIATNANEKTREVRLGLVMYGGVSLAIYINGVAHELFRAVRGRGVYRLLKRLTRSDVTVDVLSGTSAGGINGIFLAYALCNEVEFGACASLWREHGDIDKLLRKVDAPPASYASLLDSEGFYQPRLIDAFASMAAAKINGAAQPEDPTPVSELDLIVTGTDFNGRVYNTVDDRGNVLQVKDHRTLFWLKHRPERKHPFDPGASPEDAPPAGATKTDTHEALAKLARITSCFPAAFAPVTVTAAGAGADARLRRWGALEGSQDRVFIDGGVLDNKPFTSTLDAIYHRTATKRVVRHLLYVEPDPEQFDGDAPPVVPSLVRAALDSLIRLPGYESIAGDLRSLAEHNDQVERLNGIAKIAGNPRPSEPGADEIYRRARLSGLADGVLGELFQRSRDGATRAALTSLRKWFQETFVETPGAETGLLETFDVDLRLRRIFTLTYACELQLLKRPNLLRTLNNQLQVLEMIRGAILAAVARVAREPVGTPAETWSKVRAAVERVLAVPAPADYSAPDANQELLKDPARKTFKQALDAAAAATGAHPAPTLLAAADSFIDALVRQAGEDVVALDAGFAGRDRVLYPLEVVSGIHEKDVIHTVRVSPIDAQDGASDKALKQKVTGVNLGHFAAFFKRSWRSNDILWGRLDAANELVDTLLDKERLCQLRSPALWNAPSEAELAAYLPQLTADKRARLADAFQQMQGDETAVAALLPEVKRLLIEAAQNEILVEGLPLVIEDAAEEQMLWNEYSSEAIESLGLGSKAGSKVRKPKFTAGVEVLDPTVISQAAAEIATASMKALIKQTPATALVERFNKKYAVGSQTLDDIPRVVLLDIFARALLVVRNSLLQAAGPRAEKLTGTLVYKVFLDWPLRTLAALAGGLRRAPAGRRSAIVATLLYAVLSAVVVYKTRFDFGKLGSLGTGLFVGLPVLMLGASSFLMSFRKGASYLEIAGRLLWTAVKTTGLVALLGVLGALWLAPAEDLCGSVVGALVGYSRFACGDWLVSLTTGGKFLVFAAVVLTPLAWVWAGGRRALASLRGPRPAQAVAPAAERTVEDIRVEPGVM